MAFFRGCPLNNSAFIALAVFLPFSAIIQSQPYAAGAGVEVWYSGEDSENNAGDAPYTLAKQPDLSVEPNNGSATTIIPIDTSVAYQPYLGFGIAMDETACYFLSKLNASKRAEVMHALFDPENGSGINMIRLCIGASDLTTREFYSYNDMPSGETDPNLEHFSIQKDIDYNIVARVRDALAINPAIKVFASPWSPPGWMKTSGSMVGGKLKPEYYNVFAKYLVKFIQAYREQGIDIYAITPQNEPDYVPDNYPGCRYSPQEEMSLIHEIRTEFDASGIDTRIWILDHNYDLWDNFAKVILDNETAKSQVDGTAFHPYVGNVEAMTSLHEAHPDKSIHFTEKSRKEVDGADDIIRDFRNWAESATMWASIGDGLGTGCAHYKFTHCPVIITSSSRYVLGDEVFIFGQFARFIQRGARRIYSDYGSKSTVTNVCYKNPDGSITAVVCNQSSSEQEFALVYGDSMIRTTLPALTVATFLWTPAEPVSILKKPGRTRFDNGIFPGVRSRSLRIGFDKRWQSRRASVKVYNALGESAQQWRMTVPDAQTLNLNLSQFHQGTYHAYIQVGNVGCVFPFALIQ